MNSKEREQLRRELDALEGTGRELDGFTRVRARITKTGQDQVLFSLPPSEFQEIVEAAQALDRNVSEFIREAALKEARQVRAGINEARAMVLARQDERPA